MLTNLYKTRSKKLKQLGFGCYADYLVSPHWVKRRAEFEAKYPRRCRYCPDYADHLHHRRYRNLGAEKDEDLEWVCGPHHAEITKFGSIQPATEAQKRILRGHLYPEGMISTISFGAAFDLIGRIGRREVTTPLQLSGSANRVA